MKKIFLVVMVAAVILTVYAEKIYLKNPEYNFFGAIRDKHKLYPDSLVIDSDAEVIHFPSIGTIGRLGDYNLPNLKKVIFENIDYIPGGVFDNMPMLEEVEFKGIVGHFDCVMPLHCSKLRKITFKGPVSSTGGPGFAFDCASLDSVIFESVVGDFGLFIHEGSKCPNLQYINNGAFLKVYNDSITPVTDIAAIRSKPLVIKDMGLLADWQCEVLRATNPGFMRKATYQSACGLQPILSQLGSVKADSLKSAMEYAWNLGDEVKTELDILKESPAYRTDTLNINFEYACPTDSMLTLTRERFNLDSIAGNGDDVSRIKNLMYWVHNNITHDGSAGIPNCNRNLREIYDASKRYSVGVNCRGLAICLAEALLAEGIPARYVTCLPKAWDSDNDCHVICVAWSKSLDKWIWVDPTFAAFVTDENGLLLHPGEVRHRLQRDLPLFLNKDANWNNRHTQTKEDYIDYYMAKNLYILQVNSINQAEPEWTSLHPQGIHVALVPENCVYPYSDMLTTDEEKFWQSPLP